MTIFTSETQSLDSTSVYNLYTNDIQKMHATNAILVVCQAGSKTSKMDMLRCCDQTEQLIRQRLPAGVNIGETVQIYSFCLCFI